MRVWGNDEHPLYGIGYLSPSPTSTAADASQAVFAIMADSQALPANREAQSWPRYQSTSTSPLLCSAVCVTSL